MLAVSHHYQGSNPTQSMWESWQWLVIGSSPVSSTSYNWLVPTQLQYDRKSDGNRNYSLLWEIQSGSVVVWVGQESSPQLNFVTWNNFLDLWLLSLCLSLSLLCLQRIWHLFWYCQNTYEVLLWRCLMKLQQRCYVHLLFSGQGLWHDGHDTQTVSDSHVTVMIYIIKGIGIRFIVLYPPKCSHNLPSLAGL